MKLLKRCQLSLRPRFHPQLGILLVLYNMMSTKQYLLNVRCNTCLLPNYVLASACLLPDRTIYSIC